MDGERKMNDLISRQMAIDAAMQDVSDKRSHDFNAGATRAANRIKLLSAVEAEPVRHGHWEPFDEDEYTCSLCGNIFVTMDGEHPLSNEFKFCPFCGAKMDAGRKEE